MHKIDLNILTKNLILTGVPGFEAKFTSDYINIKQKFECDFVVQLHFDEQIYLHLICLEPNTAKNKFIVLRWDSKILYKGKDLNEAFAEIRKAYLPLIPSKVENVN